MITRLHINKYKCLRNENMEFRPLTVLAGTNSSGKSSVLQAILLLARNCNPRNRERMYDLISKHQELHCDVSLTLDSSTYHYRTGNPENSQADILRIEKSLYFLGANRMGAEDIAKLSPEYKVGNQGEFLFGTFTRNQNKPVPIFSSEQEIEAFARDYSHICQASPSVCDMETEKNMEYVYYRKRKETFSCNIGLWLSYLTEVSLFLAARPITPDLTNIFFVQDNLKKEISPFNLGSGMSYLAKVLILCFLARPGDVVMIENPEIHLHPRAQSRLGEFFAFMASRGVQLVIETHCKDILNSLHYQLYAETLKADDVIIYYKASSEKPFQLLSSNDI